MNTTTQGAAGASAGAALAASTLIIWLLSLRGIIVPPDVATAMEMILTVGTHAVVTYLTPKTPVAVPTQTITPKETP